MTQGFNVVDNRRLPVAQTLDQLPVRNGAAALQMANAPVETVASDAVPYEVPRGVTEKIYDMGRLKLLWGEYLRWHAMHLEAKKWMDTFKDLLDVETGNATLLRLESKPVATYRRNGQLGLKRLAAEQPQIVEKYTKMKWVEEFDKEAFASEEPTLYGQYRARRLVLVSAPKDLVLPK